MELETLTIKAFQEGLAEKRFTALEVSQAYFKRIKEKDKKIGSYLSLFENNALKQAEKADLALAQGKKLSPLAGVPLAIKDNILIEGTITTAASKILEKYKASYDATVIKKLKDQGAVFLGKTNMDEFAMGASTENSAFKLTRNPLDPDRVPGGSSGGSAAAVAASLALASLGSDTNGSIRQPASFCGVVGLKPTYGAVSRHGLIALGSSLDQIGPITKTVEDAAILYEAIRGKDYYDSTSFDTKFSFGDMDIETLRKITVGIPKEYFETEGLDDEVAKGVDEALRTLRSLGIKFKEISLPHTKYAVSAYYIILPAEASTNLARYDGVRYARVSAVSDDSDLQEIYFKNRGLGFGPEPKRRILLGTFVLSAGYYDAYYTKAQKMRRLIKQDFDEAFKQVDVIFTPTAPTPAFKIGEKAKDPLSMYLADVFTSPASLAGLPALNVPVMNFVSKEGLPVGFQLIGNHKEEACILDVGHYYERAAKG